jgi:hypothetical protein
MQSLTVRVAFVGFALLGGVRLARAQEPPKPGEDQPSVADKLQNPVADLTTIPLQSNFDFGAGDGGDDFGYTLNFQPVIPIPLGDVKVISRTILPLIDQPELAPGIGRVFGLGDLTQSFFISPAGQSSLIWGFGPVFLLPTATDERLGTGKWGIGPTAVVLLQAKGWTAGLLFNHIWSFAGGGDRSDVNNTFLQPFVSRTWPSGFGITVQTETTYDWEDERWTVPLAAGVSQVVKFGALPVSFALFGRVWVAGPDSAPDWGIRVPITFVLPGLGSHPAPQR